MRVFSISVMIFICVMRIDLLALRVLAVLCFALGALYMNMYLLSPDSMLQAKGALASKVRMEDEPTSGKYKYRHLLLNIAGENETFRVREGFKQGIKNIYEKASIGDTLTFYYRTETQARFGDGERYDVYQVQRGNELLFSIEETRSSNLFAALTSFGLSALLFGLAALIQRARAKKANQA
jgi:hypothetical protein